VAPSYLVVRAQDACGLSTNYSSKRRKFEMPDQEQETSERKEAPRNGWAKLLSSKTFWHLWCKIASGAGVLAILGYMLSWGFVTLNALQDKVAKLEQKERDDTAQWEQILRLSQETRENEIEIKVLLKLYEHQQGHFSQPPPDEDEGDGRKRLEKKAEKSWKGTTSARPSSSGTRRFSRE
jgi:hypothetical protein